jgi:acetyl/propionyl-CoA carboxylase alpha subunit
LNLKQEELSQKGYALECRLYAENPLNNFLPATGKIVDWYAPVESGIRIDAAVEKGSSIGISYDPMIAKIICHDQDRFSAIRKMSYYLKKFRCQGLVTNQLFLIKLMQNQHFINGDYDTHFISEIFSLEQELDVSQEQKFESALSVLLFRIYKRSQLKNFPQIPSGWRNNYYQDQKETFFAAGEAIEMNYRQISDKEFIVKHDQQSYPVTFSEFLGNEVKYVLNNCLQSFYVAENGENSYFVHHPEVASLEIKLRDRYPAKKQEKIKGGYEAPMPGEILKILVSPGQLVEEGSPLVILVSMKMENTVSAATAGIVTDIFVKEGELVSASKLLLSLTEISSSHAD